MIDRQLDVLNDTPVPPAREAAKARALAAAMAAFEAAPVEVIVPRGPKPFMLRHGYTIAASLATICVIGPLLFSSVPRREQPQIADIALRARSVAKAPEAPAKELKIAPPVVLAAPAAPAAAPAQTVSPAQLPANPANTFYGIDDSNSSTRFGFSGAPPAAKRQAEVATPAPDCPPGRQCLKILTPPGMIVPAQPQPAPLPPAALRAGQAPDTAGPAAAPQAARTELLKVEPDIARLASRRELTSTPDMRGVERLRAALESGRWPAPAEVDVPSLIGSVSYDGVPLPTSSDDLLLVAVVTAPWSAAHKIAIVLARVPAGFRLNLTTTTMLRSQGAMNFSARTHVKGPDGSAGQTGLAASPPRPPTFGGIVEFMWEAPAPSDGRYGWIDVSLTSAQNAAEMRASVPISTRNEVADIDRLSTDQRFALAVARFGQLLRGDSINPAAFDLAAVIALAEGARGADPSGERAAFVALMRRAKALRR